MQNRKLNSRKANSVLVSMLATFVVSSVMLIQPLGLLSETAAAPAETAAEATTQEQAGGFDFDPVDYFELDSDLFDRSQQDYDYDPVQVLDLEEGFTGDYDPEDEGLPPEDFDLVQEQLDSDIISPSLRSRGISYTAADYTLYINANSLNLRAGPSLDTSVIAKLKFGDKVTCEGENDEWMKVRYEDKLGYLKTEYTSKKMVFASVNETMYVSSNTLRLRSGPSVEDEILATLKKDDKLVRSGVGDGWSRVKTSSGKSGYVSSQYLTSTAPVVVRTGGGSKSTGGTGSSSKPLYSGNPGKIVDLAYKALGVRYVWGSHSMSGMDCTGLTYWAYRQIGVAVPRSTSGYYSAGASVSYSNIKPGDVIGWDAHPRRSGTALTHVGIYVGNGMMIHASSSKGRVVLQSVKQYQSYGCKILTIRRFVSG